MIGDARLRPRRAPGFSWSRSAERSDPGQGARRRSRPHSLPVGYRSTSAPHRPKAMDILARRGIARVAVNESAQAKTLIQLAHPESNHAIVAISGSPSPWMSCSGGHLRYAQFQVESETERIDGIIAGRSESYLSQNYTTPSSRRDRFG